MSNALKGVNTQETPQSEAATSTQVANNAGGFVFTVTDKDRLERFLILGTDGGTYYVKERKHTNDNVDFLRRMIAKDERLVVDTAVDVSVNGRAYKNSPALFAIALVLAEGSDKAYAREAVDKVARTSTHLFEFAQYVDNLGGWGRAKRGAVADWYTSRDTDALAYQAVKYRQRDGWTHRDLFRLSHPKGVDKGLGHFILGSKPTEIGVAVEIPKIIAGYAEAQAATTVAQTLVVLDNYKNLPWEALRTEHLKSVQVWKKLFDNGQLQGQALVRNVTRLARLKAFTDLDFAAAYAAKLTDEEMLVRTRLHPINLLNASVTYNEGQIDRNAYGWATSRKKDWTTESVIADALDEAFHKSFKTITPAGKRTFIAIDVSGSMGGPALGIDLSCAQVSGAVAMTIARTEPKHIIRGFSNGLTDLGITAKTTLSSAMNKVQKGNFGGTDCAQPMVQALAEGIEIDTFVVITDNETWAGYTHPFQALKKYRKATGIDARLAVLGVASTDFTIADPRDRGMMDFVGFDSNAPRVLADFSAGRL